LPDLLRRVAALTVLSVLGITLLTPLSARSALPEPASAPAPLLAPVAVTTVSADRGMLAARTASSTATLTPGARTEQVAPTLFLKPGSAPMQATIVPMAPQPVTVAASGDTIWDTLAQCESSGDWAINTGNGYYGGLQFSYATWHGYGGGAYADYPHQATREEQIAVAERLRAARGYAPWPACRVELGLP
jgi:hypothetical protein